jgi:hypothetical protein
MDLVGDGIIAAGFELWHYGEMGLAKALMTFG